MLSTVTFILGVKLPHSGPVSAFATDFKAHLSVGNVRSVNGNAYLAASGGIWQQDRAYINLAGSDSLSSLLVHAQDPVLAEQLLNEAKLLAGKSQGKFVVSPSGFQIYMEICPGEAAPKAGKATKAVSHKDPNAPKRPLNAYMLYSAEQRAHMKQDNPDMSHKDIMRALGEDWKGLSEADKEKYVKMQNEQKAKYEIAMKNYNAPAVETDVISFV